MVKSTGKILHNYKGQTKNKYDLSIVLKDSNLEIKTKNRKITIETYTIEMISCTEGKNGIFSNSPNILYIKLSEFSTNQITGFGKNSYSVEELREFNEIRVQCDGKPVITSGAVTDNSGFFLQIQTKGKGENEVEIWTVKNSKDYQNLSILVDKIKVRIPVCKQNKARYNEKLLEFDEAAKIYKELGMDDEVIRIRKLKADLAAPKTEIHGDYVDDRDTIVKDSVVSNSNVGAGGKSKSEELRDAKALLDDGIIDNDEFKQMKKEILGK